MVLEFGSRSGSVFALALFGTVFVIIGVGVAIEARRRAVSLTAAYGLGLFLFAGPIALIYGTSLNGFYEAAIADDGLVHLHYLLGYVDHVPLSSITSVEPRPWYKGRWRLHITDASGATYESATWHRVEVRDAATRLNAAVARAK